MIIFLHRNFILVHMNYETATEKYRPQTDNFQIILLSISRPGNKSFVYWKNLHSFPRAFDSKLSFFFCVPSFSMIRIYQHKVGKIAVFVFSFYLFVYSLWTQFGYHLFELFVSYVHKNMCLYINLISIILTFDFFGHRNWMIKQILKFQLKIAKKDFRI